MSDCVLACQDVGVNFSGFQALDHVTMHFEANRVHALIGPNGAGKTTIIDIITGKTRPTAGHVLVGEQEITGKPVNVISRLYGIGRKFQGANVFDELSVYDNLFIAFRKFSRAHVTKSILISPKTGNAQIEEVLSLIDLDEQRDILAYELSHGQRQWLEIGMVIVQNPKIIILDEPTAGMTAAETDKTAGLIRHLAKTFAVIVVEHDMPFIRKVADTVTVLNHGQVIAEGDYDTVKNDPQVKAVYLNAGN